MKKPESKKDLAEDVRDFSYCIEVLVSHSQGGKTPKKGDKKAEEAKSPRSLGRTKSKHVRSSSLETCRSNLTSLQGSKADLKKDDKKKDGGKKKK